MNRAVPLFRKVDSVARITALVFAGQLLILQTMVWVRGGLTLPEYFFLGNDFEYLYNGAGLFLSGRNPYLEPNFVPLPSALYLPMLLHPMSFWMAAAVFRTICLVGVVAAMFWLCREFRLSAVNTALVVLAALTYGPLYIVLVGGNLDALMLTLLIFTCVRPVFLRGIFLGLSIATKFYSLLLIPVLALRRRWLETTIALGTVVLLLLPFAHYWPNALASLSHRTSVVRLDSNQSPAVLFILLFGANRVWAWRACYFLLWGGTLALQAVADVRKRHEEGERFASLSYIPWMAAAPVLVFTYTGTILLPLIVCLARTNQIRSLRWPERLTLAGILATGLYPALYRPLLVSIFRGIGLPAERLVNSISLVVAPIGISAILIGSAWAAWKTREENPLVET